MFSIKNPVKNKIIKSLSIITILFFILCLGIIYFPDYITSQDSKTDALFNAIANGDINTVSNLINQVSNINSIKDEFGNSPLHIAIKHHHLDIVKILINKGINLNEEDKYGRNALHLAIIYSSKEKDESTDIIWEIIDRISYDDNIIFELTDKGKSPLHLAIEYQLYYITELLMKLEINRIGSADVDIRDNFGWTPLHYAVVNKNKEIIELMLDYGANPYLTNKNGQTPFEFTKNDDIKVLLIGKQFSRLTKLEKFIYESITKQDVDKVIKFLRAGASVYKRKKLDTKIYNIRTYYGHTPLHYASMSGNLSIMRTLITLGSDVNAKDNFGYTPLLYAVERGNSNAVRLLLKQNISENAKTKYSGNTSLHMAVEKGYTDIVKLLIRYKPQSLVNKHEEVINAQNTKDWTPLHFAYKNAYENIALYLIKQYADETILNINGYEPIEVKEKEKSDIKNKLSKVYYKIEEKEEKVFEVEKYEDPKKGIENDNNKTEEEPDVSVNEIGENDAELDYNDTDNTDNDITNDMDNDITNDTDNDITNDTDNDITNDTDNDITNDTDNDITDDDDDETSTRLTIFELCEMGEIDQTEILINNGEDVNQTNVNGDTPLHIASEYGYPDVAEMLISYGADINAKNNNNETPLYLACKYGYYDVVEYLVNQGADINIKTTNNDTPLNAAVQVDGEDIVDLFIDKNIDVNQTGENGNAALHTASESNNLNIVRTLLENGAEVDSVNNEGKTPLHLSSANDYAFVTITLIQNGANVNATDENGNTPLHEACANGSKQAMEILINAGAVPNTTNNEGKTCFDVVKDEDTLNYLTELTS